MKKGQLAWGAGRILGKTASFLLKKILPYVGIGVLYFVLSLPHLAFKFPDGYSELRFTGLVTMATGLLFGFPGALACALGNLVGDLVSGIDIYCVFGFLGNFSMAWLPYKMWHTLRISTSKAPRYLDSPGTVLKFALISSLSGVISVGIIAAAGHLLGGYVYSTFFFPVTLQYYDLSIIGGMLIFHLCTRQLHIVPHIPKAVYEQTGKKKRYRLNFLFAIFTAFLSVLLAVLTLNPDIRKQPFVMVLCVLFLLFAGLLAAFPMKGSGGKTDFTVEYHPVKGLTAHFIVLFLIMLCAVTTYFTLSTFKTLYTDFLFVLGGEGQMGALWTRVLTNVAVGCTLLVGILSAMLYVIQKNVIEPAAKVAEYAARFVENQELSQDRLILKKTDTELDDLSAAVDHMAQNIRDYVEDIKLRTMQEEKLAAELSVARNIQQGMLPGHWAGTGFDLVPYIKPAREVGGDFYHFVQLDENRVFLCIADVSGKDISAAMFMIQAKTLIDANCALPPNEIFMRVNTILSYNNKAMMFVTAFAAIVDRKEKTMIYANAGHNPPIYCCDGEVKWLAEEADFVLGPMANTPYRLGIIDYKQDFKLFIYTDGVNEAEDAEKEFFGNERLYTCIEEAYLGGRSCAETVEKLAKNIEEFTKGVQQSDDITMLALAVQ